jgi:ribose 5-phosphate isomerase A
MEPGSMKQRAGYKAAELVSDGMVIGIGTGSTTSYALERIAELVRDGNTVLGVPTSFQAEQRATDLGIPLTTLKEHPVLDLTIDGADQVDPSFRLVKGRGAAQVRERVVADASERLIIVIDESKLKNALSGDIPVEVIPFASPVVMRRIIAHGGIPVLREGLRKDGPVISDNGNFIIDASFPVIECPGELERDLNNLPGVTGCGLFCEFSQRTTVIVGTTAGCDVLDTPRKTC